MKSKKLVLLTVEFVAPTDHRGRFSNLYDAQAWCKKNGYSYGNGCYPQPTALMIGKWDWIAKWKNLTKQERDAVDGILDYLGPDGYRISIYRKSPELLSTHQGAER